MESLTAKSFSLADVVKALAFNVPMIEPTAPCEKCYAETEIAEMENGLCPECAEHPEENRCRVCGDWFYDDDMATSDLCLDCDQAEADYLKYCAFAGK